MHIKQKIMIQGLFKQRQPRKFDYKARYYNKIDEDIRRDKILDGSTDTHANFGDRFRRKIDENRKKRDNSIKKIAVLLAVLGLLLYFLSR